MMKSVVSWHGNGTCVCCLLGLTLPVPLHRKYVHIETLIYIIILFSVLRGHTEAHSS